MCGIVAVLPCRDAHSVSLADASDLIASAAAAIRESSVAAVTRAAETLESLDRRLQAAGGVRALVGDRTGAAAIGAALEQMGPVVADLEIRLEGAAGRSTDEVDAADNAVARLKDVLWSIEHDRLAAGSAIAALAGPGAGDAVVDAYASVHIALASLDRLEVRGRDSAGLLVLVAGHGLDAGDPALASELASRSDALLRSGSVRVAGAAIAFVYKVAAEIGELGDNTGVLRSAIAGDDLLRRALASGDVRVAVLGHTRWASIGLISEPNAHPLDEACTSGTPGPLVLAALNGDIDNHAELRRSDDIAAAPEITTDAKLIPVLISRGLAGRRDGTDAFRAAVARFNGSVAIAAAAADEPDRLYLALRGSGQSLYVGLAEGAYVVASEPYGLVDQTRRYVRLDGEAPSASGTHGQVVVLDRRGAGTLDGIARLSYDGGEMAVTPGDIAVADVTTRDIDRAGAPHFLIKEIFQAPDSVRKTLRARVADAGRHLQPRLPDEALPEAIRLGLKSGRYREVVVIGQGTAAIAGQAVAMAVRRALAGSGIHARAIPSSELSGFELDDDMSDRLVVAISQSGTTVDTNRTVDLVRARGASILALVNRRNSDLVVKSHGVLYTSDGRDQEMAVPSTKAFYAQVVAGFLLACALADAAGCADAVATDALLRSLHDLPSAMETVLSRRDDIALAARRHGPPRRNWTVVGNGPNRVAAEELRIKLSELCYKAMSVDWTEDKKHIDISSEPLIFVCAAGLDGPTAEDVAKEVAYYRAHKAAPIAVVTEGTRVDAALEVIEVPPIHPDLAFLLSALAGHLFGYEAAMAIDSQARELREARGAIETVLAASPQPDALLDTLTGVLEPHADRFFARLRDGAFNGHLEADVGVRVASLLRYATGLIPLESFAVEFGRRASPAQVVSELVDALSDAIDQLTRTIDSIKHQAKTVTVGITRSEEAYFEPEVVQAVLRAGAPRDQLSYGTLRTLGVLDEAVVAVAGYTRYRIDGDVDSGATIHVTGQGGIAEGLPSRTDRFPVLRGTKRRAAAEREVTVARGRADGRVVLLVPEIKQGEVVGMTLLHVQVADVLDPGAARRVLDGYRGRYQALVDAVTETDPEFSDDVLGATPLLDLLVQPVHVLADRWRG